MISPASAARCDRLGLDPSLGTLIVVLVGGMLLKSVISLLVMRKVGYANAEVANQHARAADPADAGRALGLPARASDRPHRQRLQRRGRPVAAGLPAAAQFVAEAVQTAVLLLVACSCPGSWPWPRSSIGAGTGAAVHFLVGRAKKAGRAQTQLTKELVSLLTDTLDNLKPLKAMGAQRSSSRFFDRRLHRLRRALRRQVVNREALRNGQDALLAVCMGVAAYLAIVVFQVSLEQVIVVGVILSRTVKGFGRLQGFLQQAVIVESPFQRGRGLIAELAANQEDIGGGLPPAFEREIRFEGVRFAYGDRPVLKGAADRAGRQHHRAHRPVGRRQDHADRPRPRPAPADLGPDPGRRRRPRRDRPAGLAARWSATCRRS